MTTSTARRITIVAAALCLPLSVAGLIWYNFPGQPPDHGTGLERPDPRVQYPGPFRNVHPSVGYVPEDRCAECHPAIAASYRKHPMGRSMRPITEVDPLKAGAQQHNPFEALGARFRATYEGHRLRHE